MHRLPIWSRWIFVLVASLAALTFSQASAQEEPPAWRQNLDCDTHPQKYRGVEYCTGSVTTEKGESRTAHVVVVDLFEPGVRFEYVMAWGLDKNQKVGDPVKECKDVNRSTKVGVPIDNRPGCDDPKNRNYYPVMTLEEAVERAKIINSNAAFLIDSDYSACIISLEACGYEANGEPKYRDHGPQGLTVVHNNRLDGKLMGDGDNQAVKAPWLAISENSPLTAEIHQLSSDDGSKPYGWIYTGVGGGPWLIQNSEVKPDIIKACISSSNSCRNGASQVAVGLTQDGRWLFLVLAEKPAKEDNLLLGLAKFMDEQLDVWRAIKLDGGGSSQLWSGGHSQNNGIIYREEQRSLSHYLAVIAESGDGIDDEPAPPPEPEPVPPPGGGIFQWLKNLIMSAYQWFLNIIGQGKDLLSQIEQAQKDWEEFQKNIQDPEWWAEQLAKWLTQLCGAAFIPAGAIVLLWVTRKRRAEPNP